MKAGLSKQVSLADLRAIVVGVQKSLEGYLISKKSSNLLFGNCYYLKM